MGVLWAAMAVVFFLTVAFVLSPLWRRRAPSPFREKGAASESEDEARASLEEEKQALLALLRDLEEDFREGRITESEHQRLRESHEARVLAVMAELERLPRRSRKAAARKEEGAPAPPERTTRILEAAVAFLVLGLVAGGIYGAVGGYEVVAQLAALEAQGLLRDRQPDVEAAVARLEAKLKDRPRDIQGHLLLARSYLALQRAPDALRVYERILRQDPRNVEALSGLGLAHWAMKRPARALEAFRRALKEDPHAKVPLFYTGAILASQGDAAGARRAWTTLLDLLPPDSQDARMVRDALAQLEASPQGP